MSRLRDRGRDRAPRPPRTGRAPDAPGQPHTRSATAQAPQPGRRTPGATCAATRSSGSRWCWSCIVVADGRRSRPVHRRPTRRDCALVPAARRAVRRRPSSASTSRAATSTPGRSTAPGPRCSSAARRAARRRHRAGASACSPATSAAGSTRCCPAVIDIVLGIPLLLAAIVLLKRVGSDSRAAPDRARSIFVLGAPRLDHGGPGHPLLGDHREGAGLRAAARMLGAGNGRIMWRHILPNSLAPVDRGADHRARLVHRRRGDAVLPRHRPARRRRSPGASTSTPAGSTCGRRPTPLIVPSAFLALTVLAFIMLGDAIRDAFDPKLR